VEESTEDVSADSVLRLCVTITGLPSGTEWCRSFSFVTMAVESLRFNKRELGDVSPGLTTWGGGGATGAGGADEVLSWIEEEEQEDPTSSGRRRELEDRCVPKEGSCDSLLSLLVDVVVVVLSKGLLLDTEHIKKPRSILTQEENVPTRRKVVRWNETKSLAVYGSLVWKQDRGDRSRDPPPE
jgi:hypothetical protein